MLKKKYLLHKLNELFPVIFLLIDVALCVCVHLFMCFFTIKIQLMSTLWVSSLFAMVYDQSTNSFIIVDASFVWRL